MSVQIGPHGGVQIGTVSVSYLLSVSTQCPLLKDKLWQKISYVFNYTAYMKHFEYINYIIYGRNLLNSMKKKSKKLLCLLIYFSIN